MKPLGDSPFKDAVKWFSQTKPPVPINTVETPASPIPAPEAHWGPLPRELDYEATQKAQREARKHGKTFAPVFKELWI